MNLAKKYRSLRQDNLYRDTAERFGASYVYVTQIASGLRNPNKKKGLAIKKHLEAEIAKLEQKIMS